MANVSTLQQRQQEIHRPFQPFTDTKGRAGGDIPEPQERYAGGWNVGEVLTKNIPSMLQAAFGGKSKDEIDPLALETYAQAAKDYEEHLRNITPEERDKLKKWAESAGQTEHEYLKSLYSGRAEQFLTEQGISATNQRLAKAKIFVTDTTGAEEFEKREYAFRKAQIETAIKEGVAIYNSDGTVNERGTLAYMGGLDRGSRILVDGADTIMARNNITKDMYARADDIAKRQYNWIIQNDAIKEGIDPLLRFSMDKLNQRIRANEDPTDIILGLDKDFAETERYIAMGYWPSKDIQDNLNNYIKTYKDQATALLKDKSLNKDYLSDQLASISAALRLRALMDPSTIGDIARLNVAAPDSMDLFKQVLKFQTKVLSVGQTAENFAMTDLYNVVHNMTDNQLRDLGFVYLNTEKIYNGQLPTYGSEQNKREAYAFADNDAREAIRIGWNKIPEKKREQIQNYLNSTLDNAEDSVAGRRSTEGKRGQYYADFLDKLNKPDYITALMLPENSEIRTKYVSNTDAVIQKVLRMPSGPSGVFKTTPTTASYRRIIFDEKGGKFYSPTGNMFADAWEGMSRRATNLFKSDESMFETTDVTWNRALDQLNTCYTAAVNAEAINRGRVLTPEEQKQVADYMVNLLKLTGVNPEMFEPFNKEGSKKKTLNTEAQ